GRTGASRNQHMADLIARTLPKASTRGGGALVAAHKPLKAAQEAPAQLAALAPVLPKPRPADEAIAELITSSTQMADSTQMAEFEELAEGSTSSEQAPVAPPSGWAVQVASLPSAEDAQQFLSRTRQQAGAILAGATGFTELFEKDGTVYHRARFGVFPDQRAALKTCASLQKQKIACYAVAQ